VAVLIRHEHVREAGEEALIVTARAAGAAGGGGRGGRAVLVDDADAIRINVGGLQAGLGGFRFLARIEEGGDGPGH
jgi:hypothetical protein